MITIFGRPLWHIPPKLISFKLDGEDTSRQIFDIYSFSHAVHGILFYFLFKFLKIKPLIGLYITIIFVMLWEMFENTETIINKYRKTYRLYEGDSIVNIIGDIIFTVIGYFIAFMYPGISIIYLILSEIVLMPYKANFLYLHLKVIVNI